MRIYKHTEETASTNTELKNEIYSSPVPVYTVLSADRQTAGRGRLGRSFYSPSGGLYFSAALPIPPEFDNIPFITLLSGLAAAEAVEELSGARVLIKWPNDLYINGKKAGGILCELVSGCQLTAVIGMGINLTLPPEDIPGELKGKMTSLKAENAVITDKTELMMKITAAIDKMTEERDFFSYLAKINARLFSVGKSVKYHSPGGEIKGVFTGIFPDGAAEITDENGKKHKAVSGEIVFTD